MVDGVNLDQILVNDSPRREGHHIHNSAQQLPSSHVLHSSYQHHNNHFLGRHHTSQTSSFLGANHEWWGQPNTFTAAPLSWFQRYYAYRTPESGLYRRLYRDENYNSSGSLSEIDDEHNRTHGRTLPTPLSCGALAWRILCCACCCCCHRSSSYGKGGPHVAPEETISLNRDATVPSTATEGTRRRKMDDNTPNSTRFCFVIGLTIVLIIAMLHISKGNHMWILNPGESHLVRPAYLTDRIVITSGAGQEASVYTLKRPCPALTGPILNTSFQNEMSLGEDGYQYDHFYLNQHSTLVVQFAVTVGSVDVYLLQGRHFLSRLEKSSLQPGRDQYLFFNRFVSSTTNAVQLNYNVTKTDVYIVLYDNASSGTSRFSSSYSLQRTTYDVISQSSPKCPDIATKECTVRLPFFPSRKECILVQTEPSADPHAIVSIRISQRRRYGWIVLFSLLPLIVYTIWPSCHLTTSPASSPHAEIFEAVNSFSPDPPPRYLDFPTLAQTLPAIPAPLHVVESHSSDLVKNLNGSNHFGLGSILTSPVTSPTLLPYQHSYSK